MRKTWTIILFALLVAGPAAAVPTLSGPTVTPSAWSPTGSAAAAWIQQGFEGLGLGPATIQVNTATDGGTSGSWVDRHVVPGPLADGAGVAVLPVGDLEGRRAFRVVVAGALGSPLLLGIAQLDRSAPRALGAAVVQSGAGNTAHVSFQVDDAGMAGVGALQPALVEFAAAGTWTAAHGQPTPGPGDKTATITTTALPDGEYPVRVWLEDVIANRGARDLPPLVVDRTPPTVSDLALTRAPTAGDPTAELTYVASDVGSGLDAARPARAEDATRQIVGTAPNVAGRQTMTVTLPGAGRYALTVTVHDRGGQVGTSEAILVDVPPPPGGGGPTDTPATPPLTLRAAPRSTSVGARWAFTATRRFHRSRGLAMPALLSTASSAPAWTKLLGRPDATRIAGYTTRDGVIALGPNVTRGLERLNRLRLRPCMPGCPPISRAEADLTVGALAVLLHESLHVTGATRPFTDLDTPPGEALEEGLTEAATIDLLPRYIQSLGLAPTLRAALRTAAARYRPRYPTQTRWVRQRSAEATATPWASTHARNWRIEAADTWGADRWARLSAATQTAETTLRADIPTITGNR